MAIAYVAGGINQAATNQSTLSVTVPAGAPVGSFAVVFISTNRGSVNVLTPPAGWTAIPGTDVSNSSAASGTHSQAFYKFIASGEPGNNYGWAAAGGSVAWSACTACYTGVDPTTPFDVASTSSTTATVGPLTAFSAPTLVVYLSASTEPPAGFTERLETVSTTGTNDRRTSISDKALATAASTGSVAGTSANVPSGLIILRDVAGVVPNIPPTSAAGADQLVSPGATVTLTGTPADSDGTVASVAWTKVSGTNTPTLSGASTNTATFTAPSTVEGDVLVYRFTVTDDDGATTSDDVTITVSPVPFLFRRVGGVWVRKRLWRRSGGVWV